MPEPFGRTRSTWKKRSKICPRSSFEIPSPVSESRNIALSPSFLRLRRIVPLSGVYLKAFETRLKKTRSNFSPSMAICIGSSGRSTIILMSRFRARARKASIHSLTHSTRSVSVRLSFSLPFSYLRKSSIWLIRRLRILTFLSAIFMSVCCCGVRLPAF